MCYNTFYLFDFSLFVGAGYENNKQVVFQSHPRGGNQIAKDSANLI